MALEIGRKGQVYLKKEAAYGTEEALAAANALRHLNIGFGFDPFNRVTSPEKKQSPGPANRFDRRKSAELATLVALLRPSGALNTLPEIDPILEAAFGTKTNVTLSTTVSASPSPTAGGCTVADAGSLAAGDAVLITVTGKSGPYVRILTDVTVNALTWAPDLPAAPTSGDAVKGGVTYQLTTDLAVSLTIAHYLTTFKRELLGAGIDSLAMAFDANEEPRATASGPAANQLTGTTQSEPASFTAVGGNPPSGLVGELYIGNTAYLFKRLEATISNGLAVRNQEYGVSTATEIYRQGRREISLTLEAFAETEATLYDLAEAGTNTILLKQSGKTEGNIVAVYAPKVEFKVPDTDDPEEEVNWSFAGMALESVDGANDELSLALM
jgi:hypothetical protein